MRALLLTAGIIAAWAATSATAEAAQPRYYAGHGNPSQSAAYGRYSHRPYYGAGVRYQNAAQYGNYSGYGKYGGYHRQPDVSFYSTFSDWGRQNSHGHDHWHDTSHYDYHPGGYVPHYDHFDYVPGHYDYHREGHWDHHH